MTENWREEILAGRAPWQLEAADKERERGQQIEVGARVESARWGDGQPRISGVVVAIDRHLVTVRLRNGQTRKRSISNLRRVEAKR